MAIFFGIATNGGMQTIVNFLHLPSFIMTVGGALFAVMMTSDSFSEYKLGITGFFDALSGKKENLEGIVNCIYDMSEMSRKEGLLSLEDYSKQIQDAYLAKGITLVVDGTESELIRDIMETEMNHKYDNDKRQIGFWQDFGAFAPAWGMVGTLIGLINIRT